jgi:hypothetical protein
MSISITLKGGLALDFEARKTLPTVAEQKELGSPQAFSGSKRPA